jgi:trans-aconitate 2-methyltransferase
MSQQQDDRYTFGDTDQASARLRRLAELYAPETRDLLARGGPRGVPLALDLGCGPGWTTRLLAEALRPVRTVGLDRSARYVAEARRHGGAAVEYAVHDVTRAPLPVPPADVLLCRFLLTHLADPAAVLATWAEAAAPAARLLVHETEVLRSDHAALARYYALVAALQAHYGQALDVGPRLAAALARTPWRVVESRAVAVEKPAAAMAELHVANLRTWRDDPHARAAFDPAELDRLEAALLRVVRGEDRAVVVNVARQVVAERP